MIIDTIKNIFGLGPKIDYAQLVKDGALVIDVRTADEYKRGRIPNTKNIPVDELRSQLLDLPKDKTAPIITCCVSGMRSGKAKQMIKEAGYTNVHNAGNWKALKAILK